MPFDFFNQEPTTRLGMICENVCNRTAADSLAADLGADLCWERKKEKVWRLNTAGHEAALVFDTKGKDWLCICRLHVKKRFRGKGFSDQLLQKFLNACNEYEFNVYLYCQPYDIPEEKENDFFWDDLFNMSHIVPVEASWIRQNYLRWNFQDVAGDSRSRMVWHHD